MSKIDRAVYYITFIFAIVAFVVILKVSQRYKIVMVLTDSMDPALKVNSLSILDKCRIEDVKIGDIIMYQSHVGFKVTHRVIDIQINNNEIQLITKGDRNPYRDFFPITKQNFLGKIIYTNNNTAKYFKTNIKAWSTIDYGSIAVIICFISSVIILEVAIIKKALKYMKKSRS